LPRKKVGPKNDFAKAKTLINQTRQSQRRFLLNEGKPILETCLAKKATLQETRSYAAIV